MDLLAKTDLDRKIAERVLPVVLELGLELVRVRTHEGREMRIQIMADRQEGRIDLDDCALLSRAIRPILDALAPGRSFALEVSSPGLDRPLTRMRDFDRFAGSEVRVETSVLQSGRRRFRGILLGLRGGGDVQFVTPESDLCVAIREESAGEVLVPYDSVTSARLSPDTGARRQSAAARRNRKL